MLHVQVESGMRTVRASLMTIAFMAAGAAAPAMAADVAADTPRADVQVISIGKAESGMTVPAPKAPRLFNTTPTDAIDDQDLNRRDKEALRRDFVLVNETAVGTDELAAAARNDPEDAAAEQADTVNDWTADLGSAPAALTPPRQPGVGSSGGLDALTPYGGR
jgi:hypothetical protein